jgi:ABC-type branched-subunit amino acid transport system substrate-binding protein
MSTALGGPTGHLGSNMRDGVEAALAAANRSRGVRGRELKLIALDDGYEPKRTVPNMWQLINEEKVLAIIGNVGTPTAVSAIPIAIETRTPFFGAYTGAGVLRKSPPDRYVINYRASYAEETAAMVNALILKGGLRPREIAFFTQRDAYGDAGFVGGIAALKEHGLESETHVAHGRYERNTLAVENGLADIMETEVAARAIIMVGAYAPCAAFIRLAREFGYEGLFLTVSFTGSTPLKRELGDEGDGVIITQVVPHVESELPAAERFRAALREWDSGKEPTFGAFEGYIACTILLRAMESIAGPITREGIVDALEGLGQFDIGLGTSLELDQMEHQACHTVWPTVLRAGKIVPFSWDELVASK